MLGGVGGGGGWQPHCVCTCAWHGCCLVIPAEAPRVVRQRSCCAAVVHLLCGEGVGDELHMVAECPAYAIVRQRHSPLFECLGGWQHVVGCEVSSAEMRGFMSQQQGSVASFVYECSQRRWQQPPAVLLGEVDGAEAAAESDDEAIISAALGDASNGLLGDLSDGL